MNSKSNNQKIENTNEIGKLASSSNLEYAEISKYYPNKEDISEEEKIILTKIKFFYKRDSHLISIQYIYQKIKDINSKIYENLKYSYLYPQDKPYFGPNIEVLKKKSLEQNNKNSFMQMQEYKKNKTFTKNSTKNKANEDDDSLGIIDEITLSLDQDEYIYKIEGFYSRNRINGMIIKTTKGQLIEFGIKDEECDSSNRDDEIDKKYYNPDFNFDKDEKIENKDKLINNSISNSSVSNNSLNKNQSNFIWNFHFNKNEFGGFIVGWDDKNINYLSSIIINTNDFGNNNNIVNDNNDSNNNNNQLIDVTNSINSFMKITPIIESQRYGYFDNEKTILNNPYTDGLIFNLLKDNIIYLGEFTIYYTHSINKIELVYKYINFNDKNFSISYEGKKYNKNNNKQTLFCNSNEYICKLNCYYNKCIEGLELESNTKKKISIVINSSCQNKCFKEVYINMPLKILGLVAGFNEQIDCLKCYYINFFNN